MTTPSASKPLYTARDYAISVAFSAPDAGFVATCPEFPSLSCVETRPGLAVDGMFALLTEITHEMAASHEALPVPLQHRGVDAVVTDKLKRAKTQPIPIIHRRRGARR